MKYFAAVLLLLVLAGCQPPAPEQLNITSEPIVTQEQNQTPTLGRTNKTAEQWKDELSTLEYHVLWNAGTEPPYTGGLLKENRSGTYVTRGCKIPVFRSETKYKSGTGWPSFYDVIEENVEYREDYLLGHKRIEVVSTCGEHLGHVFEDGPAPTGLRYCMNSAALDFIPDESTAEE